MADSVFASLFKNSPKPAPAAEPAATPDAPPACDHIGKSVKTLADGAKACECGEVLTSAPPEAEALPQEPPAAPEAPTTPPAPEKPATEAPKEDLTCPKCKKEYKTKSGLKKHYPTCEGSTVEVPAEGAKIVVDEKTGGDAQAIPPDAPAPDGTKEVATVMPNATMAVGVDPAEPGGDKTAVSFPVQDVTLGLPRPLGKVKPILQDGVLVGVEFDLNDLGKALVRQWQKPLASQTEEKGDDVVAAAIDTFYEKESERKKQRLAAAVEALAYLKGADQDQIDMFTDRMQMYMQNISDLTAIQAVLPPDCVDPMQKCADLLNWFAKADTAERDYPHMLIEQRKKMVIWKGVIGKLLAQYKPMGMAHELAYYGLRGAVFTSLREVGRTLEENIRKGSTVKDTEELSQTMTIGLGKQRVYFEFVVESLYQRMRAMQDAINQVDQELIELRYQRKAEGGQTNPGGYDASPPPQEMQ